MGQVLVLTTEDSVELLQVTQTSREGGRERVERVGKGRDEVDNLGRRCYRWPRVVHRAGEWREEVAGGNRSKGSSTSRKCAQGAVVVCPCPAQPCSSYRPRLTRWRMPSESTTSLSRPRSTPGLPSCTRGTASVSAAPSSARASSDHAAAQISP
jgi:hypothetical protein